MVEFIMFVYLIILFSSFIYVMMPIMLLIIDLLKPLYIKYINPVFEGINDFLLSIKQNKK